MLLDTSADLATVLAEAIAGLLRGWPSRIQRYAVMAGLSKQEMYPYGLRPVQGGKLLLPPLNSLHQSNQHLPSSLLSDALLAASSEQRLLS